MASFPPSQPSQRRQEQSSSAAQPGSPVLSRSATSEDSQTVFLHSPPTDLLPRAQQAEQHPGQEQQPHQMQHQPQEQQHQDQQQEQQQDQQQGQQQSQQQGQQQGQAQLQQQQQQLLLQKQQQHPPNINHDDDPSILKCWICFADSTEDTPESSPWRDPCPCALVAHEECLLDWIADTEAPKNNRSRSIGPPHILCPQCKSEIKLARPRDYVVESVRGVERLSAKLVTPAALTLLSGLVIRGSMAHGIHSVYRVFGAEDGFRILRPLVRQWVTPPLDFDLTPHQMRMQVLYSLQDHLRHWRLYFGLPFITPLLILSRTTLADATLPVLPVLFFATQAAEAHATDTAFDLTAWPPSAGMAFAVLPYVRAAYNSLYDHYFAAKERQWLREIQPRINQPQDNDANNDEPANPAQEADNRADDENVFEVRIDGGIWEDWVEEDNNNNNNNEPADHDRQDILDNAAAPPQQQPQNPDDQAPPPPNIPDNRPPRAAAADPARPQQNAQPPAPANPQNQPAGERRLSFSPISIAETVLGALLFPTLAELSGEILRLSLPKSWTASSTALSSSSSSSSKPAAARGLLQEKWARSLIGGCLFVVAKDALLLYVRWRMARMHRSRRVLDVDRSKIRRAGGK